MSAHDFDVHAAASTSTVASEVSGRCCLDSQFSSSPELEAATGESPGAEVIALGFLAEKCPGVFMCLNNAKILER